MTEAATSTRLIPEPAIEQRLRFITATSLFDGHDASINVMRRILQAKGVEVIHLGHDRSVEEIVTAAIQEDAHGIAVSSYQGGHIEYFKYMVDMLREQNAGSIRIFAGGGGVIIPEEIQQLQKYGVCRIYSPADGQQLGLTGMIDDMLAHCDYEPSENIPADIDTGMDQDWGKLSRLLSTLENNTLPEKLQNKLLQNAASNRQKTPVLGITGTGGSGKSSVTDELVRRFRLDYGDEIKIAIIAVDPSRRKTSGALLGDRIRMNAIDAEHVYMRSLATRSAVSEIPANMGDIINAVTLGGFDLVIVETPGIGQGDAGIVPLVDVSMYVMTPEFGAATQLEKIDMLDFADVVAINKFDRKGGEDALRDVSKQVQRNREAFDTSADEMPVFGTVASRFNDDGLTALYQALQSTLSEKGLKESKGKLAPVTTRSSSSQNLIVPSERQRYLAEIAETIFEYRRDVEQQVLIARQRQQLVETRGMLKEVGETSTGLDDLIKDREQKLEQRAHKLLDDWPKLKEDYAKDEYVIKTGSSELKIPLIRTTLSGTQIRKVVLPKFEDQGEILRWLLLDNVPGSFPFTAGVFNFKREGEDPARMFAGEGDAFRTNKRFKFLAGHAEAKRLSTAFDSVTLYARDPDRRPDIYGKVGNSGVSIATLEDMKVLYEGFDLCDSKTSVSMTINGPAPTILAMFFNTAIDQQIDKFRSENNRAPDAEEYKKLHDWALQNVRGTVQADILKEDQGQNTCVFSTEFSLKAMGDIQEYFIQQKVRNFYSVSISGYHIAEAGANPISQLAFTLANGFTYVEAYLARGMHIDDFAANLSFFFSNGMDPEYTVMGRVARRIWATAMRFKYGANERSQKLKYHIQTSGRSLHAQEIDFNDIRTTLQALIAVYDNCNSLHTNAADEAITTPTENTVRRALAIQMIINQEWGLNKNENPNQGAFIIEELTDLVETAVLAEFQRISDRGGVLGAMETGYQRGKIQDESLDYEHRKHDGSLPIIGVNTFINPHSDDDKQVDLARSTDDEKQNQIKRLKEFHLQHKKESDSVLETLKQTVMDNGNVFAVLMSAVRVCSLGQITDALFEVGGKYRRNM